jgi:hypothetical protein
VLGTKIFVAEESSQYDRYLPAFQRMVDTFRIGTDSTSNAPETKRTTTSNTNTKAPTRTIDVPNVPLKCQAEDDFCEPGCEREDMICSKGEPEQEAYRDEIPLPINDPCNYHGLNVCNTSGECDNDRFDCASDDCINGQSGTTGQCEGDDEPYGSNEVYDYEGACDENDDYCDQSEGCGRSDIDCIDDVNEGDDGEDGLSCQPEDDFCEPGCESPEMDCIDDVNEGDDGEDSVSDDEGDNEDEDTGEADEEDGGDGIDEDALYG